jgi:hypothetical protein
LPASPPQPSWRMRARRSRSGISRRRPLVCASLTNLQLAAAIALDPQEPEWGLCDPGSAQQHRLMPPPDMSIPIVYRGQRFPSRKALALHLAPLLGQSVNTLLSRLTRYDGDVERALVGRYELCEPRPIAFEGQVFPSRQALARHLSPLLGRSIATLSSLLSRYDGDVERVVRSRRKDRFAFGGRVFPTRKALAEHLAPRLRRSPEAVVMLLLRRNDDAARLMAERGLSQRS